MFSTHVKLQIILYLTSETHFYAILMNLVRQN